MLTSKQNKKYRHGSQNQKYGQIDANCCIKKLFSEKVCGMANSISKNCWYSSGDEKSLDSSVQHNVPIEMVANQLKVDTRKNGNIKMLFHLDYFFILYWKFNCSMNPYVHLMVRCLVGRSAIISHNFPCSIISLHPFIPLHIELLNWCLADILDCA